MLKFRGHATGVCSKAEILGMLGQHATVKWEKIRRDNLIPPNAVEACRNPGDGIMYVGRYSGEAGKINANDGKMWNEAGKINANDGKMWNFWGPSSNCHQEADILTVSTERTGLVPADLIRQRVQGGTSGNLKHCDLSFCPLCTCTTRPLKYSAFALVADEHPEVCDAAWRNTDRSSSRRCATWA